MDIVGLLLDVGPSMGHENEDGSSDLDKAKNILSLFVQRKIFSQSDDRLCLFSYGSDATANELATDTDYQHISMEMDLRPADWELCRHIQGELEATNHRADFLDALIVVSTYLMNQLNSITDKKLKKKMDNGRRIIMILSNMDNPVRSESQELKSIIQGLKENQIELHFVGLASSQDSTTDPDTSQPGTSKDVPDRPPDGNAKPKTANQSKSESIVQQIVNELDGCAYDFREALAAVSIFEGKKKNSMAWNPDLVIGSSVRIPISGFKWVTREALPSFKKCSVRNPNEEIKREYDTFLPDDTSTEVDKEDIIKGYRYGTDLVPFTADDMANMKYKCDVREFSVIGFTSSSNIKRHYFAGKDTMLVLGRKNNQEAAVAVSALTQALQNTDSVAVVRKVYSANSSPTIGALMPVTDGVQGLCFVELPFTEDMRELEFPSLYTEENADAAEKGPTKEQLKAVDELIDAMDMSAIPDDIANPTLQRLFQVLAAKAADETCSLPELSSAISNAVNNTAYSSRWSDREQENFTQLYKLEKNEKLTKGGENNLYKDSNVTDSAHNPADKGDGEATNLTSLRSLDEDIPTEVRSIAPVQDFKMMLKQPKLVVSAFKSMAERILQLVQDSIGETLYNKALECLQTFRAEAVAEDDEEILKIVNDFLLSMKALLVTKGPADFWLLLIKESITLIDSNEASNSSITSLEKDKFLEDKGGDKVEQEPVPMDDDDLLDMM
ncbi:X-ray repair cross-complementing protein 5-like isoform X2 [Watersipora subatra]|uniref:X-ray repair cross-complementing protein 5-like isoform X2 n=1 Tax=Watersipora subatra TaxID=2589382 RepID=UPI00355B7F11